jgi:hypothetical protein
MIKKFVLQLIQNIDIDFTMFRPNRTRTDDLLLVRQSLYRLSYGPGLLFLFEIYIILYRFQIKKAMILKFLAKNRSKILDQLCHN